MVSRTLFQKLIDSPNEILKFNYRVPIDVSRVTKRVNRDNMYANHAGHISKVQFLWKRNTDQQEATITRIECGRPSLRSDRVRESSITRLIGIKAVIRVSRSIRVFREGGHRFVDDLQPRYSGRICELWGRATPLLI